MDKEQWQALEFKASRHELNNRIDFLHKSITTAVIFWLVFLIATFFFLAIGLDKEMFITYLLLIPLVIDLLAFNYQSNQNSLESIPRYYFYYLKPQLDKKYGSILEWEKYFADDKEPFKYESVTKVFPFVLPSIIPIYFLFSGSDLNALQIILVIVDILFLVLMLESFRYKLRRVK